VEFDPLHADVSTTAPSNPPLLEGQGDVSPSHSGSNLSARFGDIFNTTAGCMIDGIPSTCDMAMSLRNRGAGDRVTKALVYNHGTRGIDWYGDVHEEGVAGFTFLEFRSATGGTMGGGYAPDTYSEVLGGTQNSSVTIYGGAALASTAVGAGPNYIQPQQTGFDIAGITTQVDAILSKLRCIEFGKRILNAVSTKDNPVLRGGDMREIFDDFLLQENGGYTRTKPPGSAGYGSPTGLIRKGDGTIFSRAYPSMSAAEQTAYDAGTTVAELFHMAGQNEYYTDRALAEAAHNIPEYAALYRGFNRQWNVFDPSYVDKAGAAKNPNHAGWSSYFHDIQRQLCGP